ncbi:response regulator [Geobacter argillaceus]|uniref:Response regulator receiver domain-containing protein n=1 Tax=Geobacter argillaceus TaxID=345631 RepID=A0A562WU93_9BACT|nr:response regulator [Geobacter argillaceus]TWJ33582.1 response regulator receiver domain-containing protein [Geobacter argillaceus]
MGYNFSNEDQIAAKGKTILLVEDSPDDALLTQRSLKKANVLNEVVWLKDGAEALDYLFKGCLEGGMHFPQVVLLDIHMPRVDGIEVLRAIRADDRLKGLPVIIFTSSKEEQDLVLSYRLGVNSFIRKPVDFGEFATIVSTLGCYWLLVNRSPLEKGH